MLCGYRKIISDEAELLRFIPLIPQQSGYNIEFVWAQFLRFVRETAKSYGFTPGCYEAPKLEAPSSPLTEKFITSTNTQFTWGFRWTRHTLALFSSMCPEWTNPGTATRANRSALGQESCCLTLRGRAKHKIVNDRVARLGELLFKKKSRESELNRIISCGEDARVGRERPFLL